MNLNVQVTTSQKSDCPVGTTVALNVEDLQDMQNDFQEKIDSGLQLLAESQGKDGLPRSPAPHEAANPDGTAAADPTALGELQQQQIEANNTEEKIQQYKQYYSPSAYRQARKPSPGYVFSGYSAHTDGTARLPGAQASALKLIAWTQQAARQPSPRPQQGSPPKSPSPSRPSAPPAQRGPTRAPTQQRLVPPKSPMASQKPTSPRVVRSPNGNEIRTRPNGVPATPGIFGASKAPAMGAAGINSRPFGNTHFSLPRDARGVPDGRGGTIFRSSLGEFHSGANHNLSELRIVGGDEARFDASRRMTTVHAASGLTIHYGLNGARRVENTRADGTRVVSTGRDGGYVERAFLRGRQAYVSRTYIVHGRPQAPRVFARYFYRDAYLSRYVPAYVYGPAFYAWARQPWSSPVYWKWSWAGAPWVQYYSYYFVPPPYYVSAAWWLTDSLLAANLEAAYEASVTASSSNIPRQSSPGSNLTANVPSLQRKHEFADEVKGQRAEAFGVSAG